MKIDDQKQKLLELLNDYQSLKNKVSQTADFVNNDSDIKTWIKLSYEICENIFYLISSKSGISFNSMTPDNIENLNKIKKLPDKIASCLTTVSLYIKTIFDNHEKFVLYKSDAYLSMQLAIKLLKWHKEECLSHNIKPDLKNIFEENNDRIVIWNDIPKIASKVSKKISEKLIKKIPGLKPVIIENCEELIRLDISRERFLAVILLVTDQTKLSQNEKTREKINKMLFNFVSEGGNIIGSHDLIYKRTKNIKLQEIFGCTISEYFNHTDKPIEYIRSNNDYIPKEFKDISENFFLYDCEVVTGNWSPACTTIFEGNIFDQENHFKTIPLVTLNDYGTSACIWLNSGHYQDKPPASISDPQDEFIDILAASINFFKRKGAENK